MDLDEQVATLRKAAARLRATDSGSLMRRELELALADVFDLEAATRGEMENFAELINAAIETSSGIKGYLRFGRDDAGQIQMQADTIEPCLAAARIIAGIAERESET